MAGRVELSEERRRELQEFYSEKYRDRLRIQDILQPEVVEGLTEQKYSMHFPIFGPHRNRGGRVHFDDKPHIQQLADRHADAYQLAPLYGEVEGYEGEPLFSHATVPNEDTPYPSDAHERIAEELLAAIRNLGLLSYGPPVFVGPSSVIPALRGPSVFNPPQAIRELRNLSPNARFKIIPRAPRDRVYVLPYSTEVAELHVRPRVGEVEFGQPLRQENRFVIEARAWNRLEVADGSLVLGLALQARTSDEAGEDHE